MLIKLASVNEEVINFNSAQGHKNYTVTQVYINPQHIVVLKEDIQYVELNVKNKLPDIFEKGQNFTRILLNRGSVGEEITVIGDLKSIATIINEGR